MAFKPFDQETQDALQKLSGLKNTIYQPDATEARIEFLTTVFRFDLYNEINENEVSNYVNDRQLHTCMEMGDGEAVVFGVMSQAVNDPIIKSGICMAGQAVWDDWLKVYSKIEAQRPALASPSPRF